MRDIKFRGKRIDNGEWVYGSLVNNLWDSLKEGTICEILTTQYVSEEDSEDYYDCWEDIVDDNVVYRIDPTTIGQYTGLKDKNGVEIFEGDRIKIYTDQLPEGYKLQKEIIVCEIEWESGGFHAINHETEDQFPLWKIDTSTTELIHDKELKE